MIARKETMRAMRQSIDDRTRIHLQSSIDIEAPRYEMMLLLTMMSERTNFIRCKMEGLRIADNGVSLTRSCDGLALQG